MIVVVGLSHKSAPIEVRERLALPRDVVPLVLRELVEKDEIAEAMLVSTCNRVEMVAAGASVDAKLERVAERVMESVLVRAPNAGPYLYTYTGADAVRHLFRVASSLDSLVLGEPQILGQVKEAFELAREVGTVGAVLHRAVPRAIRAAKRVRTETAIGTGQVSVPSVAVDLAAQIFGELSGRCVVLIGSGEMAETVAKLLRNAGCRMLVVGRNEQRVAELSRSVGGEGRGWHELRTSLVEADVVITSTSAPTHVVDREVVKGLRKPRRGRSLFFIDLAVPRDVEPAVAELDGVFLYNVDDFSKVVSESLSSREREAERAHAIVDQEAEGYERWAEAAQVTPTVLALRTSLGGVMHSELQRSLRGKLKHLGTAERQALEKMLLAALNKMLHTPTTRLRQVAADRDDAYRVDVLVATLTELFSLDSVELPAGNHHEHADHDTDHPHDHDADDSGDDLGVQSLVSSQSTGTDPR